MLVSVSSRRGSFSRPILVSLQTLWNQKFESLKNTWNRTNYFQVTQCSAKSWVDECEHILLPSCGLSLTTNLLKHGRSYWSTLVLALLTCLQTAACLRLAVQVVHNALVRPRKLQACCHANMGFFCTMSDMLQQCTCVSDVNYFESLIFFEKCAQKKWHFLQRINSLDGTF